MHLVRTNAILPFAAFAAADFTGKEGLPVKMDGATGTVKLATDPVDPIHFGVILEGRPTPEKNSIAVAAGGMAGTVRVKLLQDVPSVGAWLQFVLVGGVVGFGPDTGAGARVIAAQSLEKGVAGELIEAAIFMPFPMT